MDPINPYAAPATLDPGPHASEWHGAADASLRKVAGGLSILRAAVIVTLLASAAILALTYYPYFGVIGRYTWRSLYVGIVWIAVAAGGIGLVGKLICLSAPAETHPRRWVGAAALAAMLNIIVTVNALLRAGAIGAWYARDLLGIFAAMAIAVFLRKLARFLGRNDSAQLALTLLILGGTLLAVELAYMAVVGVFASQIVQHLPVPAQLEWMLYVAIGWLRILLPLLSNVLFLILLTQLRSAILTGHSFVGARLEQGTGTQ